MVLTPTLPPDSDKMKLLSRFGKRILQTKGNALRKQGWWTCGADGLIFSAGSECWVAKSAVLPSDQALENLRTALSTEKTKDEPSIGTSQVERLYNAGTESGLLGANPEKALILASDGSVDAEGRMWAGVYVSGQTSRLLARIGRDVEGSSSLRAELGGGFLGLRKHKDTAMPVILFSDSETFLEHIEAWIDEGSNKCPPEPQEAPEGLRKAHEAAGSPRRPQELPGTAVDVRRILKRGAERPRVPQSVVPSDR